MKKNYEVFRVDPPIGGEKAAFQSDSYLLACLAALNLARKTGLAYFVCRGGHVNDCRVDASGYWYFAGNGNLVSFNPYGHAFDL